MSNNKELKISIYNEVNGRAAVSSEDGERIFYRINKALQDNAIVILDFLNIEILTSAFLNTAVGQLYNKEYSVDFLKEHVKVSNVSKEDFALLARVLERAKEYFRNPEYKKKLDEYIKEELGDEA